MIDTLLWVGLFGLSIALLFLCINLCHGYFSTRDTLVIPYYAEEYEELHENNLPE